MAVLEVTIHFLVSFVVDTEDGEAITAVVVEEIMEDGEATMEVDVEETMEDGETTTTEEIVGLKIQMDLTAEETEEDVVETKGDEETEEATENASLTTFLDQSSDKLTSREFSHSLS
ncbi:hypothetical protein GCK72_020241 [Caenorhabditis remanei]|uniref:Uncharacterized protein n=1 Tax=Caenorhabditis remanei TaxID=31234 RepID=A0A6A5GFZ7_CAERE|nr:hypothetical protein GCK72_020241 [Caenorhabditis remanei]KAF1753684.1 hypothetical protein GCK72_020241 [Caenorhabditis remanei]